MGHLTVDDIINFVSLTELNKEAIELSLVVNGHIRKCNKCLELVRSFQIIHDEFTRLEEKGDFRRYISDIEKNEDLEKLQNTLKEINGLYN